jgi:hypothetical protein
MLDRAKCKPEKGRPMKTTIVRNLGLLLVFFFVHACADVAISNGPTACTPYEQDVLSGPDLSCDSGKGTKFQCSSPQGTPDTLANSCAIVCKDQQRITQISSTIAGSTRGIQGTFQGTLVYCFPI